MEEDDTTDCHTLVKARQMFGDDTENFAETDQKYSNPQTNSMEQ